ncbi:MAG: VWA domain-containing protein [Planctomycetes bacterium]|nr:VWA domain-containing protein [Planctomycetota bacterium]
MGSYSGGSDWDDVPAASSFSAFKPTQSTPSTPSAPRAPAPGEPEAEEPLAAPASGTKARLNAIFAFDTTGSMTPYVENVQQKMEYLAAGLLKLLDMEISLLGVGDHGDGKNMLQIKLFSSDLAVLKQNIHSLLPTDGRDTPEAFECLFKVLNSMEYDVPTVLVVVTDSIPHGMKGFTGTDDGCPFGVDYAHELAELRTRLKNVYLVSYATDERILALQEELVGPNAFLKIPNFWRLTNLVMAICMNEVGELDFFLDLLEKQRGRRRRDEVLELLGRH